MAESTTTQRVETLVAPIVADLQLDLYDVEMQSGVLRITLDTPPGSPTGGITLDSLALATRLISRELDHDDPINGHYSLEVTSPGLERILRTPAHFHRAVGKTVALRLRDIGEGGERRLQGIVSSADDDSVVIDVADGQRTVPYAQVDRARTVFVWGPSPKPGHTKKEAS